MSMRIPQGYRFSKTARCVALAGVLVALVACGPTYRNHGYVPPQEDLDQIVVGIDTRSSVEETLGTSGSTSVLEDDALYFVRSRMRTVAMLDPEVVERQVVAVSFDDNGIVENVESFGLERGQIVSLTRRVTDSSVAGKSFLRQLVGNIGSFTPSGLGL
ncbi:outer membrane protein assembly factor BamE [Roseobacter denitrificans]|uniref:Lipoprotein, putative n=1 Tax=Roseobacter denitrificans (strain ATCC 33942 / OCh 114) TaxID=375451 RepID=Q164D4_ROSDO|nr:outer membrane protein assembly factor BamE [Roseobacter denitrificans]ABG32659.1 lipoprotein, putative [Roseobacter denitrificans OCh 114]AVL52093.1 outer membrane protein assembly factor BamE [Roseobacter denitrificans]SFF93381.1 Beta-barrel assembly machine subunit BamE [Roseobacter denitrificans OCh 114]